MEVYVVEYLEYLKERKHRSTGTLAAYEQDLFQFLRFLQKNGIQRMDKVDEITCNSFLLYLESEGLNPSSIQRKLSSMRGFFDFLIRRGEIRSDPTEELQSLKIMPKERETVEAKERKKLLEAAKPQTAKGQRDAVILSLIAREGLQPGEIAALQIEDINFKLGILKAKRETHERNVQISAETLEMLVRYQEERKSRTGYLFPSRKEACLSRQAIWKLVRKYARAAGISDVTPQQLRRRN